MGLKQEAEQEAMPGQVGVGRNMDGSISSSEIYKTGVMH